jgi:hypothetical protein
LVLALLPACRPPGRPTESATAAFAGEGPTALRLELRTDRAVYAVGEPVELTLAATNPGLGAIAVLSPSSQLYDFTVLKEGAEVWRWSAGRMFLAVLTPLTIPPGRTRAFTETWDQRDRNGRPVPPGEYVAVGILIGGKPQEFVSQPRRITIRERRLSSARGGLGAGAPLARRGD